MMSRMHCECLIAHLVLLVILSPLAAQASQSEPIPLPANVHVVDGTTFKRMGHKEKIFLVINEDERVFTITFRQTGESWLRVGQNFLGQLENLKEPQILADIPPTELPIFATRISIAPNMKVYAVVTACLCAKPATYSQSRLHVFEEHKGVFTAIMSRDYSGVPDILLDDLNGDGLPELAAEWTDESGKSGDIDVWAISAHGNLTKIEFPPDTDYMSQMRTYFRRFEEQYTGPGRYTVKAVASILRNAEPLTREVRFQWDVRTKAYRITSVTDIQEIRTSVPSR